MARINRKPTKKRPWIGVITIDIFEIEIPVFFSPEAENSALIQRGITPAEVSWPKAGYVSCAYDDIGRQVLSLVINPDGSDVYVWVHEIVHIVDFLFEYLGITPGIESTEVRAYLSEHLLKEIAIIVGAHQNLEMEKEMDDAISFCPNVH